MNLANMGGLTLFNHVDLTKAPLIGILDERWILAKRKFAQISPSMAHQVEREMNQNGGLSAAGMYSVLKSFFRKCATNAGQDNSDFTKASAHWLRHTFAHQALDAAQNDLGVVQQLLGNASITTTSTYRAADLASCSDLQTSLDQGMQIAHLGLFESFVHAL